MRQGGPSHTHQRLGAIAPPAEEAAAQIGQVADPFFPKAIAHLVQGQIEGAARTGPFD